MGCEVLRLLCIDIVRPIVILSIHNRIHSKVDWVTVVDNFLAFETPIS